MSNLYPHNQEIYDGIIRAIADGYRKIGYTEATGLGKSFVFIELCKTIFKGKKILYVVPKVCISEAITFYKEYDFISNYVDFTTYAMFNSEDKALEFAENYDVLFVDECHHLLSDIQGCNVDICGSLISNKVGGFYIGMSATTVVGKADVFSIFFDKTVYGKDLYDAIIAGLYPKMNYISAILDIGSIPSNLIAKYNIDCTKPMLDSIISSEGKNINKVIVYFSNISELVINKKYVKSVFKGYKVFSINSRLSESQNLLNLTKFNNCNEKCIMLSVSMLIEGVHVKGVDCAIIYRNVFQLHTLFQIVGRLFYFGMEDSPLIIDATGSYRLFKKSTKNRKESKGGCGITDRNIRDIINPICSDFRVVDFLDEYYDRFRRYVVEGYRGIWCESRSELAEALGVNEVALASYVKKRRDIHINDIIDYYLDRSEGVRHIIYPSESGEYKGIKYPTSVKGISEILEIPVESVKTVFNRYNYDFVKAVDYLKTSYKRRGMYVIDREYKGIPPFSSRKELEKYVSRDLVSKYLRENSEVDIYDLIDYCINNKLKSFWSHSEENYRGISCGTLGIVAKGLGISTSSLLSIKRDVLKSNPKGIVCDVIDSILDCNTGINFSLLEEYKGVKPFNNLRDFCKENNYNTKKIVNIIKENGITDGKGLVDYISST